MFLQYCMCLHIAIFGQALCYTLVREGWLVDKGGWIGFSFIFRFAQLDRKWGIENSGTEHGEIKGGG